MNQDEHTEKVITEEKHPGPDENGERDENIQTLHPEEQQEDTLTLLEQERARSEELKDQLQRVQAELINYRRRMEAKQDEIRARAVEATLSRFLPVADDLHRAVSSLPEESEGNGWAEGFRLIESNLLRALESHGVKPMESVGKPFDPAQHDAVMFDENTSGEHMVVEEFQRGYWINDRVLRPAMVRVGSIPTDASDDE